MYANSTTQREKFGSLLTRKSDESSENPLERTKTGLWVQKVAGPGSSKHESWTLICLPVFTIIIIIIIGRFPLLITKSNA